MMEVEEQILYNISDKNYNKLQTDFKAEAVAVNLLRYYKSNASVFLKRVGINEALRLLIMDLMRKVF